MIKQSWRVVEARGNRIILDELPDESIAITEALRLQSAHQHVRVQKVTMTYEVETVPLTHH